MQTGVEAFAKGWCKDSAFALSEGGRLGLWRSEGLPFVGIIAIFGICFIKLKGTKLDNGGYFLLYDIFINIL